MVQYNNMLRIRSPLRVCFVPSLQKYSLLNHLSNLANRLVGRCQSRLHRHRCPYRLDLEVVWLARVVWLSADRTNLLLRHPADDRLQRAELGMQSQVMLEQNRRALLLRDAEIEVVLEQAVQHQVEQSLLAVLVVVVVGKVFLSLDLALQLRFDDEVCHLWVGSALQLAFGYARGCCRLALLFAVVEAEVEYVSP